ncbi:hypothetical protein [Yoonia sp.]|uniref:hypothetical protein n=1 Tax=Yoonia sp. TaxID=2212373 RepID=UPI002FDB72AF
MNDLHKRLLDAHARDDRHGLVTLYAAAADQAPDANAACFMLTHAYVFGLEVDHPLVPSLFARLKAQGRL